MAIPTTGVSFSSIQTEFGGSRPISISEYYKGGTYVPSAQTTSATDGTTISPSAAIRIGTFRGLSKTIAGGVASSAFGLATNISTTTTGIRSASFRMLTDGTSTATASDAVSANPQPNWYSPTTTSIGNSYWVRAVSQTNDGGTFSGTAFGTWIQLSTQAVWTFSNGATNRENLATIAISIAASSGGTVLGTYTVDFDVGYTP